MSSTNRSQSRGASSRNSRHRSRPPTCPDENELVLLADGALADNRRASIDRHLDGCAPCTRLVAELAGMAAPVRPVPARYKVIRQLGAGAMGVVWEAEDNHLGRRVALKFVRADKTHATATGATAAAHRERRTRLFREARALAQLRHRNVVSVYDVGESGDELFLALELVIGMDARTWRAARPRTTDEILAVWRQAVAGLAAVHRAGIVHRDIKPDNILVADDGRVLVGDFGLATDRHTTAGHAQQPLLTNQHLTATGAIVGTPIYMAYEQLVGEPATQRSDQYALCVSIWEALAGERPFTGPTLGAITMAMQTPPAIPASRHASERHVFAVLARGLAPNPARRWPNLDALLAALDTNTASRSSPAKSRAVWLALGAASVAAAATAGVLAWREGDGSRAGAALDATKLDANRAAERAARLRDATPTEREAATPTERVNSPTRDSSTHHSSTHDSRGSSSHHSSTHDVPHASIPTATPPRTAPPTNGAAPAPVTQSDWRRTLDRATDKLGFGEGRACLQLLASMPPVPAVMEEQAETLRAMCTMKAGDCAGGRALLDGVGRANGWDAMRLDEALRNADFMYCPLDAGARTAWVDRAKFRLRYAAGAKTSCQPVLAFLKKHGLQLPNPREQLLLETTCRFNAGDCTGARIPWRKSFALGETEPTRIAEREQVADTVFVQAFPSCP